MPVTTKETVIARVIERLGAIKDRNFNDDEAQLKVYMITSAWAVWALKEFCDDA